VSVAGEGGGGGGRNRLTRRRLPDEAVGDVWVSPLLPSVCEGISSGVAGKRENIYGIIGCKPLKDLYIYIYHYPSHVIRLMLTLYVIDLQ
jgi:hypothetical protein